MLMSEERDQIFTALANAQAEFKTVKKSKRNPHFKNTYADIGDCHDATREALTKFGLCITQEAYVDNGRVIVITLLGHKSGQWIKTELSLKPEGDTPQKVGSAITYGRRYALQAILGISGEEDDDGNAAEGLGDNKPQQQQKQNVAQKTEPEIFSLKSEVDIDRLIKRLAQLHVPPHHHSAIAEELNGKPWLQAMDIINKIMAKQ